MIVMTANNTGREQRALAAAFPGRVGLLLSPAGWRKPHGPYALDNGAFPAWTKGRPWDEAAFLKLLENATKAGTIPLWVLVPDVVADREATIALWHQWEPALRDYGWPLAFAVQDGMEQTDVPTSVNVVFVGGTTRWKWRTVERWCNDNERVHVGRVNGYQGLDRLHGLGAESCDGTGWFRGDQAQLAGARTVSSRVIDRAATATEANRMTPAQSSGETTV
jgi:hypothetical protein